MRYFAMFFEKCFCNLFVLLRLSMWHLFEYAGTPMAYSSSSM